MTADEVSFAGGLNWTNLSSPYAWYYTNSENASITWTNVWWLLSSNVWYHEYSLLFVVRGSKYPGYLSNNFMENSVVVRPVISISKCAKVKSGIGTPESPYEIDESSCN